MRRFLKGCPILLVLFFCLCGTTQATVEKTPEATLSLAEAPLDLAVSADGRWIFVLAQGGKVHIYSSTGELQATMRVDAGTDHIAVSPAGDRLYLSNGEGKTVQVSSLSYIHDIDIAGSPVRGPSDAPVTIVTFSDFQCPYCSALAPQLEQVLAQFPEQVKLVYKHFPLRNHRFALKAAVASVAADAQGKFWPFHDRLFANFNKLSDEKILAIAKEVGLDIERFKKDMTTPALLATVQKDMQQARELEVRGTPTVFINGRLIRDRSPANLRAVIEKELAAGK
jgi:protein-disulfide isomerase